jgi:hypothetical protein
MDPEHPGNSAGPDFATTSAVSFLRYDYLLWPPPRDSHLQAIITVLSLVNPFMCATLFAQIEAGRSPEAQMGSATRVALGVFVILTVAALVGGEST